MKAKKRGILTCILLVFLTDCATERVIRNGQQAGSPQAVTQKWDEVRAEKSYENIQILSSRLQVIRAQKLLYKSRINPGPIDGILGPKTRAAIRSYQKNSGLQVDGVLTAGLLKKLEQVLQKQDKSIRQTPSNKSQPRSTQVVTKGGKAASRMKAYRQSQSLPPLKGTSSDHRIVPGRHRGKKPRFLTSPASTHSGKDYTIGGKDVLNIVVFEEHDLSPEGIRVSIDGYITFPLIGRVHVGGMSTHQVEQKLTRLLKKDYLVNPQVSVHIKEYASKVVNILGAVRTPGTTSLSGPSTLLEALGRAGGVKVDEAGQNLTVLRPLPKGGLKNLTVNLDRLLKEGDLSQNLTLHPGDTIFVPQADQIFVFGEVTKPGPYKLASQKISVVEAITLAGGLTRLAAGNRTQIVRVEDGKERLIRVNVESIIKGGRKGGVFLRSGDIVVIPQTYF